MNVPVSASTGSATLAQFVAQQAEIDRMWLRGHLGNEGAMNILYEVGPDGQGHFFVSGVGLLANTLLMPATLEQERTLLEALRAQEQHPVAGLDLPVLRAFIHLLACEIENQPSTRFNNARFGDIAREASGVIVGHCGLGVDVVGTIRDEHGVITFEQHALPLPSGQFRPLSRADRASLANALKTFIDTAQPPANPLWVEVLEDVRKSLV